MKTFCMIACVTLLAGCTSATMQQSLLPTRQEFGYPGIESQPLPPLAPAVVAEAPRQPAPPAAAAVPAAPPMAALPAQGSAPEVRDATYDETKDPMMRALVERATKPVDEDLQMSEGKLVLPPTAKLDVIDTHDISDALRSGAAPSS